MRDGNFVDFQVVRVLAGRGGHGCAAFDRSKVNIRGKPSGGNGGDGGDVIFRVDPTKNSLQHVQKCIRAGHGESGGKGNMVGAKGEDFVLDLPPGTSIRELLPNQEDSEKLTRFNSRLDTRIRKIDPIDGPSALHHLKSQILQTRFDLDKPSEPPRTVCTGGRGGKGNISMGRNNHECERGFPGEERVFELDLKTLADIGLVGLPNAGKSSFLAAVSNAHPKIAPYPFTTLNPYVGTIEYSEDYSSITVADIPGLIEGAHRNIGLGHQFLKHVVKSRALAFVIDFSRPDPLADYTVLCNELEKFKTGLASRCRLVIANKMDILGDRTEAVVEEVARSLPEYVKIIPISAMHRTGITEATQAMKRIVKESDMPLNECIT